MAGLLGFLILFATHTFVPQCQKWSSKQSTLLEFFVISMHFTATLRIPPTSSTLKSDSFNGNFLVEQEDFTTDLSDHLRTL
ncbi:hypothetical protein CS078_25875 [Pseudomonas prosekii]|uniref:Uncharacterized protein n=1 Tax=Pseudomonas prosekii TaxID=1148509 RepID=A0A3L8C7Z2_9PSED|nr:hypothetical protein CS078_25875 [Pseudomonas prosekii]